MVWQCPPHSRRVSHTECIHLMWAIREHAASRMQTVVWPSPLALHTRTPPHYPQTQLASTATVATASRPRPMIGTTDSSPVVVRRGLVKGLWRWVAAAACLAQRRRCSGGVLPRCPMQLRNRLGQRLNLLTGGHRWPVHPVVLTWRRPLPPWPALAVGGALGGRQALDRCGLHCSGCPGHRGGRSSDGCHKKTLRWL